MKSLLALATDFATTFSEKHGQRQLGRVETFVVLHLHRACHMTASCLRLAEIRALEDLWILNRSLTELTINTGYLQVAEKEELDRFSHFEFQKLSYQADAIYSHMDRGKPTDGLSVTAMQAVDKARAMTGWKDNKATWSKHDLVERARQTDRHFVVAEFTSLLLLAAPFGNAGAHSSMLSLAWSVACVSGQAEQQEHNRSYGLGEALHIVNLALSLICYSIDEKQLLNRKAEILAASRGE